MIVFNLVMFSKAAYVLQWSVLYCNFTYTLYIHTLYIVIVSLFHAVPLYRSLFPGSPLWNKCFTFYFFRYFSFSYLKKNLCGFHKIHQPFFHRIHTSDHTKQYKRRHKPDQIKSWHELQKTCQSVQSERRLFNLHVSITAAELTEIKRQAERERGICLMEGQRTI